MSTLSSTLIHDAPAEAASADAIRPFNVLAKGGHFAAWEQQQLFAEELRAGFRSLR